MWVEDGGRRFLVSFDDAGRVSVVKERKLWSPGTYHECLYNAPYWHHSHRRPTRGIAARVIAEAERRRAEAGPAPHSGGPGHSDEMPSLR